MVMYDYLSPSLPSNPDIVPGVRGNGWSFYGTTQWVNFGNSRSLCIGDLISCPNGLASSMWIKLGDKVEAPGDYLYILATGGQTASSHGIALYYDATHLGGGGIAQSLASLSTRRAVPVRFPLNALVSERWNSITVLLTRSHQCRRLVQKRPSMCYYVCVIMHVKDP